jgi:nucleoredoxin
MATLTEGRNATGTGEFRQCQGGSLLNCFGRILTRSRLHRSEPSHGHSHAAAEHGHAHGVDGLANLLGGVLVQKDGREVPTTEALAGTEFVMVYLSAHWCPPCRGFTPALSEWVSRNGAKLKLKCVFASNDRDEDQFAAYFKEMSWDHALPFDDSHVQTIMKTHGVRGIPTLLVFDGSGHLLTKEGREGVSRDADGAAFPWAGAGAAEGEGGGCSVA